MAKTTITGRSRGVMLSRNPSSGRLVDELKIPGMGTVRIVSGDSFDSAKDAAGSRLRIAIENTRVSQKRGSQSEK